MEPVEIRNMYDNKLLSLRFDVGIRFLQFNQFEMIRIGIFNKLQNIYLDDKYKNK